MDISSPVPEFYSQNRWHAYPDEFCRSCRCVDVRHRIRDYSLQAAFGGVSTILSGKKLPQNIRAPRHLTEELLREVNFTMESFDGLMAGTQDKNQSHKQTLGREPHQVGDDHDDVRQDREGG